MTATRNHFDPRSARAGRARSERGSVTVWLTLASFVMVILVGLAVDLGGQVHAQQRANDLAAQAARTGGERVQPAPAIEGTSVNIDTQAARTAAQAYLHAAGVTGTTLITGPDSITVTVTTSYRPQFLGLIGIHTLHVQASATAHLFRSLGGNPR